MDTTPASLARVPKFSEADRLTMASSPKLGVVFRFVIPAAILILMFLGLVTTYLVKFLWMGQLHYTSIFWTLFSVQWAMFAACFAVVFGFMFANMREALQLSGALRPLHPAGHRPGLSTPASAVRASLSIPPHLLISTAAIASLGIAWIAADGFFTKWDTFLRFHFGGAFGVADPLYGVDIGFYVFHLPFYQLLQTSIMLMAVVAFAASLCIYALFGAIRASGGADTMLPPKAISHLSVLLFVVVTDWGFGLVLGHYQLVYSTMGVVYGAGFTADHVTRLALWAMVGASVVACVLLVTNALSPRLKPLLIGSGAYVGLYVMLVQICPALFQRFAVVPSELAFETPFLTHNIASTRAAFDLD